MGGGEILKKGWLIKSPPLETGGMKAWRKRFFCLRSSKILEYYKSVDGDMKGVVNLEDCKAVHADLSHKKYKHVFDVETRDRTYYLVASSQEEMKAWVDKICEVCAFSLQNAQAAADGSLPIIGDSSTMPAKLPSGQPLISSPTPTNTLTPGSSSSISGSGVSFNERFKPVQNGATAESLYSLATESGAEVKRQLQGAAGNGTPAGIPLSEALASKGLGNGASRTATLDSNFVYPMSGLSDYNFFSPRPPGVNDPQGIYSLAQQDAHTKAARSATLMPGAQLDQYGVGGGHRPLQASSSLGGGFSGVSRGQQGQSPFNSAGPTASSATVMDATGTETNRAEMLENGYMAPRRIPRPAGYEYPPFGPPRAANDQTLPGSGTPTSRQPHSALLLRPEGGKVSSPSSSSSSAKVASGTAGRSATYINVQSVGDNSPPPPIDRATKPTPPAIDRTLKPAGYQSPKNTPPEYEGDPLDEEDDGDSDSSDSSPDISKKGIASAVPFSIADLPKSTNRTTQYTQVEIVHATNRVKLSSPASTADDDSISKRGPIPVPRDHPVPKPRRVNYSDIDLTATASRMETKAALRSPTLRHAEREHLKEKDTPYINVNREGEVDDDTDPDYYTHMRNLSEEDADRPSLEVLKEFIPPRS